MPRRRVRTGVNIDLNVLKIGIAYLKQIFKSCGYGNIKIDIINNHFRPSNIIATADDWALDAMRKLHIHYPTNIYGEVTDDFQDCIEDRFDMFLEDVVLDSLKSVAVTQLGLLSHNY